MIFALLCGRRRKTTFLALHCGLRKFVMYYSDSSFCALGPRVLHACVLQCEGGLHSALSWNTKLCLTSTTIETDVGSTIFQVSQRRAQLGHVLRRSNMPSCHRSQWHNSAAAPYEPETAAAKILGKPMRSNRACVATLTSHAPVPSNFNVTNSLAKEWRRQALRAVSIFCSSRS